MNGIQTYGVLGALRSFIEPRCRAENREILTSVLSEKPPYFAAVLEIPVIGGNPSPTVVKPGNVYPYHPATGWAS